MAGPYTSAKSGNWNDPTAWSPNGVPADNESATVGNGHAITLTADQVRTAALTCLGTGAILQNGFAITFNAGGSLMLACQAMSPGGIGGGPITLSGGNISTGNGASQGGFSPTSFTMTSGTLTITNNCSQPPALANCNISGGTITASPSTSTVSFSNGTVAGVTWTGWTSGSAVINSTNVTWNVAPPNAPAYVFAGNNVIAAGLTFSPASTISNPSGVLTCWGTWTPGNAAQCSSSGGVYRLMGAITMAGVVSCPIDIFGTAKVNTSTFVAMGSCKLRLMRREAKLTDPGGNVIATCDGAYGRQPSRID